MCVCSLHMAAAWLYRRVEALTFLLPSVTTRGTGMGGHLLRWGGGFSLFHKMIICKGPEWSRIRYVKLNREENYVFWKQLVYLWAIFRLGHHLQELHNWLRLGNQRRCGMDDGSEFLARHDSCINGRYGGLRLLQKISTLVTIRFVNSSSGLIQFVPFLCTWSENLLWKKSTRCVL